MVVFKNLGHDATKRVFYVFHPAHVLLSALVTASLFELHSRRRRLVLLLLVGFFGSIGIGTLSDSVIPYVGELLLGAQVHVHSHGHENEHAHAEEAEDASRNDGFLKAAHIGFIEGWYVVLPAAIIGALLAYFRPRTKFPHAGHVLLSTWASSFHMLMAFGGQMSVWKLAGSFGFLFLAVWLPCCISDIVFPLLFVDSPVGIGCGHGRHKEGEQ